MTFSNGAVRLVFQGLLTCGAEGFFATLPTELLDRSTWPTRESLANAIFAFVEGFYSPTRRHSTLGYLSR